MEPSLAEFSADIPSSGIFRVADSYRRLDPIESGKQGY
jgi:hypothetical protein